MTRRLRIGIAGAGFGQRVHVPAFRLDSRCEVAAICATNLEHATAAARQANVPEAYGNFQEMLAKAELDAVSIAAPPKAQPDLIVAAAQAGKHVFCEKPPAASEAEAARVLAAVESAGVTHAIDFLFPEIGAWQRAAAILREGKIGKPRHASLTWRIETYAYATGAADSWKTRNAEGGGALCNFVSHTLYYLEWLLGPLARVAANLGSDNKGRDARVDAWMETAAGCGVTVAVANDAFRGSGHRLEVFGEQGTMVLENPTSDYVKGFTLAVATRERGEFQTLATETGAEGDGRIGAVGAIARRFLDGILNGGAVKPNLTDGVRVQRLIAAMAAAHDRGGWQRV